MAPPKEIIMPKASEEEIIPEVKVPDGPLPLAETLVKTPRLDLLIGKIRVVAAIPTWIPRNIYEQQAIFISGSTYRFYLYDSTNSTWRYSALT